MNMSWNVKFLYIITFAFLFKYRPVLSEELSVSSSDCQEIYSKISVDRNFSVPNELHAEFEIDIKSESNFLKNAQILRTCNKLRLTIQPLDSYLAHYCKCNEENFDLALCPLGYLEMNNAIETGCTFTIKSQWITKENFFGLYTSEVDQSLRLWSCFDNKVHEWSLHQVEALIVNKTLNCDAAGLCVKHLESSTTYPYTEELTTEPSAAISDQALEIISTVSYNFRDTTIQNDNKDISRISLSNKIDVEIDEYIPTHQSEFLNTEDPLTFMQTVKSIHNSYDLEEKKPVTNVPRMTLATIPFVQDDMSTLSTKLTESSISDFETTRFLVTTETEEVVEISPSATQELDQEITETVATEYNIAAGFTDQTRRAQSEEENGVIYTRLAKETTYVTVTSPQTSAAEQTTILFGQRHNIREPEEVTVSRPEAVNSEDNLIVNKKSEVNDTKYYITESNELVTDHIKIVPLLMKEIVSKVNYESEVEKVETQNKSEKNLAPSGYGKAEPMQENKNLSDRFTSSWILTTIMSSLCVLVLVFQKRHVL